MFLAPISVNFQEMLITADASCIRLDHVRSRGTYLAVAVAATVTIPSLARRTQKSLPAAVFLATNRSLVYIYIFVCVCARALNQDEGLGRSVGK